MNILRDELKKTRDGYVITIHLSADRTEFAKELGDNPEQQRELQKDVESYVKKKYPNLKVTTAKVLLGGLLISTIPLGGQAHAATPTGGPKDIDKSSSWAQTAIWNLVDKKIIEGDEAGNFNPQGTMTRDAFTAMLVRAMVPADQMVTPETPTFKDIPKDHWAYSYVETAVAKGLVNGTTDTTFSPTDNVTREQMATIFVRALGVPAADLAGMGDKLTFADKDSIPAYAKDAVGYAVSKGLMQGTTDTTFDGGKNATREQVAVVMDRYLTGGGVVTPPVVTGKVSVSEVKPTGVKTVTVNFNRDVTDAEKATLSLTKGSVPVATTAKWSDDKKSAVLTITDTKLTAGTYTVTLGGLAADAVDKTTAEFTAQDETVSKIEFVNANDTIAKGDKVLINIKATNQYGENASYSAGAYSVYSDTKANPTLKKLDNGDLQLTLNTSDASFQSGISIVPVNIYHTDTRVTATKNFKVGTTAFISKVELGTLKYNNGKDSIAGTGETATVDLLQYDQYGNLVAYKADNMKDVQVNITPYEEKLKSEAGDTNNDDIADIKFSLTGNVDKTGDYTFNVYSQAGTASGTIKIASAKIANKVEIGEMTDVIAAGDDEAFVPIVAYDAAGNKLSLDDLVSDENKSRIKFNMAGAELVTVGEDKGSVRIPKASIPDSSGGMVTLTATIATANANSVATKSFTVQDVRVPETFKVKDDADKKIIAGAESKFEFEVYDQYGQEFEKIQAKDNDGVDLVSNGDPVPVRVDANGNITASNGYIYNIEVTPTITGKISMIDGGGRTLADATPQNYNSNTLLSEFNDEQKLIAAPDAAPGDKLSFVAKIQKIDVANQNKVTDIAEIKRDIEVVKNDADLTYNISTVGDLFNAIDSKDDLGLNTGLGHDKIHSKLSKEIELTATDAGGDKVALPKIITAVTTDNPAVAQAGIYNGADADDVGKAYIIGNKKGTAKVNVSFKTNEGETLTRTFTVNVKDDAITTTKLVAGEKSVKVADTAGKSAYEFMDLTLTDNYGTEYEDNEISEYNYLFGTTFSINNVKLVNPALTVALDNTVSIDPATGNVTIGSNVKSFEISANTAAGISASTGVTR
ncbi:MULTISPECIES: S-layer homology domain-containing protein [Paenibacillus]|uniref:S-layer homology domain-containing protein n=1 Tax=Paenibacillus TaxID=44249 RepID=UPI0022B8BF44|nr:S-layer homology domain-containing protein [Paenibacillus caseinilyticus]MCZ8522608.1 S-layer homology domain-containing protein [Paenibacillus caseinilyticus]